jgi:small redox-active disulfide protein 2
MTLNIIVLGSGCTNCHNLEANARAAAEQLGVDAVFEHTGDRAVYARYGLLATPGLVVNDRLVSGGRVPSTSEIMSLLADALS